MKPWRLFAREAWAECRFGLRSGIVPLVFLGLAAYLLMSLTNADYVQKMGASDIPRNAPSLVYLMSSGCMFFLFFAWAWVFSRPLLRDRQAGLHEVILSMPISLQVLLWGRFTGAAMVGALLGGSLIAGFLATPLLGWIGLVPASSIGAAPWQALLFSWVWILVPASTGIGALYFLTTLRTRNAAGAFGLSAVLMFLWMFGVVVLKGGHINPWLATGVDPSLFTFAQAQVETWTPNQKATALLPLAPELLFNRVVWCLLPLVALGWTLRRLHRESLVLEGVSTSIRRVDATPSSIGPGQLPMGLGATPGWWRALGLETAWQLKQVLGRRVGWIGGGVLLAMGVLSSFIHVVWHAEGPMVPRPDMLLPLLRSAIFLVIAFLVAALAGLVSRRDQVLGFSDMLDACVAPEPVRLMGRALSVALLTLVLAAVPGLSAIVTTALAAPQAVGAVFPLVYQTVVVAPALMEIALLALLTHACFRHAGLAYAASMLLTFFLVLNHELGLVSHPLYEAGISAKLSLSALTGWAPWSGYLLTLGAYKLSLALLLLALAGLVATRGLDSRWSRGAGQARARLVGVPGALALSAVLAMSGLGWLLQEKLVVEGDYRSAAQVKRDDAAWEKNWLATGGDFSLAGGELRLGVDLPAREVTGRWQLVQVRSGNGWLHAELPHGLVMKEVRVDGQVVQPDVGEDHLRIRLGDCAAAGCDVRLEWRVAPPGWSAEGQPAWLLSDSFWLRAGDAVPRLGLDSGKMLSVPSDRVRLGLPANAGLLGAGASVSADAVAPAGRWQWHVSVSSTGQSVESRGTTSAPLDFAVVHAPHAHRSQIDGLGVLHDATRADTARTVAEDVFAMQACVSRRLGAVIEVERVAQWPRGLGSTRLASKLLGLAEEPNWDVSDAGVGRWMRRAEIASALARSHVIAEADLRNGPGALWLSDGVPGAIGLLCVGDADGLDAMNQVMGRYAEAATRVLAASESPVGPLASARQASWPVRHAPLAALDWTVRQMPAGFSDMLSAVPQQPDIASALAHRLGEAYAREALGAPLASDLTVRRDGDRLLIEGARWQWQQGAWRPHPSKPRFHLLTRVGGVVRDAGEAGGNDRSSLPWPATTGLLLDAWPSYGRTPKASLLHENDSATPRPASK